MVGDPGVDVSERRATWLVLAADGPALELEGHAPPFTHIRAVADPSVFADLLHDGRPRIAIMAMPPAGDRDVELAAHPGRAFTRRQLLDRVWGLDQVGDPRTVDVHIRWLRSKVEREPEHPVHLVTVRGIGYRLDLPHR